MNKIIMIAVLSALCAFTGCNNASKQRTENTSSETNLPSCQKTSQDKPNVIEIDGTPYLALNKLLVLPDDAKTVAIPLPVSFYSYYKDIQNSKNPGYKPADSLISFLKALGFEGAEFHTCHTLPFRNKNILPVLLCLSLGDNDSYLVVTVDAERGEIIDHLKVGESTDNGIISFRIDKEFNIAKFSAEIVYNETDNTYEEVYKEKLGSYQIGSDGKIRKESINYTSNAAIEGNDSDVDASTVTQMEATQVPIVIDFLKWYKEKYHEISTLSLVNTSEEYYSVDLSECEAYLNLLQSSGYVSFRYIEQMRSYFETYFEKYKTALYTDGPPDGFDYDLVLLTQEVDDTMQAIEHIKILECAIIDSTHQKVKVDIMPSILTFSLSYNQETGWLIDNIE